MRKIVNAAVLGAALFIPFAYADAANHQPETDAPQTTRPLSEGEVRKVDRDAKKITIKHGPLADLDMPAMTMVFQIKEPALLEQAKAGDKVRFRAEKIGGAYVVTQMEAAK